MRVHVWLFVCVVLSQLPSIAAAEGREPESVPEVDATTGTSTIITQQKRERLIATDVVTARVYSTGDISGDALRVALDVARAAFAAAAVEINWKICGLADCNTPPLPKEILIRFMQSRGRHIDTRCLGEALIDSAGKVVRVWPLREIQFAPPMPAYNAAIATSPSSAFLYRAD